MGRVRIFAGPNGSGKTCLYEDLKKQNLNLGQYLNADLLLAQAEQHNQINLSQFNISLTSSEITDFFSAHALFRQAPSYPDIPFSFSGKQIIFDKPPGVYEVAILTDCLRHVMLKTTATFSFETVFSHPGKINFIEKANEAGYRTYLYFISTLSPSINIERIEQRVLLGGHHVPDEKVKKRYYRSLENLLPAMKLAYRTYIFDNSRKNYRLLARITPSKKLHVETEQLPVWFSKYVLEKIPQKKR